jgi:hypothetical protein
MEQAPAFSDVAKQETIKKTTVEPELQFCFPSGA